MSELANLPALTADELDVLGRALVERFGLLNVALTNAKVNRRAEQARRLAEEAASVRSLMVAVAEARNSLR